VKTNSIFTRENFNNDSTTDTTTVSFDKLLFAVVTKMQEDIQQNLLDFSAVLSAVFSF